MALEFGVQDLWGVVGSDFSNGQSNGTSSCIGLMENQLEKNLQDELETGVR